MILQFNRKEKYTMEDLLRIMEILRSPEGCPWDRTQTHHSIRNNMIEEAYEAVEAIDNDDEALLQEELGDVLFQVVFHAQLEEEAGRFDFSDVVDDISKKLIERHPHVFGNVSIKDTGDVLTNWEAIKARSKGRTTISEVLRGVSPALPALMRAQKLRRKASRSADKKSDRLKPLAEVQKAAEGIRKLPESVGKGEKLEAVGKLLFASAGVAESLGVESEEALAVCCEKFIRSFEQAAHETNPDPVLNSQHSLLNK